MKNPHPSGKPSPQPQGTACIIAKIAKQKLTELQHAISQLTILAFLLCHPFMQVRQGLATEETMNQNCPPLKSPFLQKWTACKPPRSFPQIRQLYQHHIQTPKEGQEK
jgi:hypothetical protein